MRAVLPSTTSSTDTFESIPYWRNESIKSPEVGILSKVSLCQKSYKDPYLSTTMGEFTDTIVRKVKTFNEDLNKKFPKLGKEERFRLWEEFINFHDNRGLLIVEQDPKGGLKLKERFR